MIFYEKHEKDSPDYPVPELRRENTIILLFVSDKVTFMCMINEVKS